MGQDSFLLFGFTRECDAVHVMSGEKGEMEGGRRGYYSHHRYGTMGERDAFTDFPVNPSRCIDA